MERASDTADVAVWYWPTASLAQVEVEAELAILTDDERARYGRFAFARDRRDFAAAHVLLRRVLSLSGEQAPSDWRFRTDKLGKPSIISEQTGTPPLTFSLSHTHGLVACAVARGLTVGIDVERVDRQTAAREVATRHFAPSEIDLLQTGGADLYAERFIELWTLKEAYIKAVGTGLGHPLDSFAFSFEGNAGLRLEHSQGESPGRWQFMLAALSAGHRLALAVDGGTTNRALRLAIHATAGTQGPRLTPMRASSGLFW